MKNNIAFVAENTLEAHNTIFFPEVVLSNVYFYLHCVFFSHCSGGIHIKVQGTNLDIVQTPMFYVEQLQASPNSGNGRRKRRLTRQAVLEGREALDQVTGECNSVAGTDMTCLMPEIPESWYESGSNTSEN